MTMHNVVPLQQSSTILQALGSGPSVLGETSARIPVGGKIRAGIKALTPAAAKNPQAVSIFNEGVAAGRPWDVIEKALREKCGFDKSPLMPRNAPYFTVRRCDFNAPEVADRLMELYGEDRGDGLHLYRFPVILPLDNWQANMPHGLRCYTRNELVYWSEYGPDGTRYCKTHGKVELDPRNRRARRAFGGRPVVLRPENGGVCSPEECPEYQGRKCTLSGSLIFFVPGIPGTSAIALPTTSFYAMQQWRQQMEMVGFIRGGRVAGLVDGKPLFWITKQQREISMLDPTGTPKKVTQHLVVLEADIPMDKVFAAAEERQQLLSAEEAAAALGYRDEEPEIIAHEEEPQDDDRSAVMDARGRLAEVLQQIGIEAEKFVPYAVNKWGPHWSRTLDTLQVAIDEVTAAAGTDIEAYIATVIDPAPF